MVSVYGNAFVTSVLSPPFRTTGG